MRDLWKSGRFEVAIFCNPGDTLTDLEFESFHRDLILINERSGANINNLMLKKSLPLIERKKLYSSAVVSIFYTDKKPCAFSLSPFLTRDNLKLLHIGLTIISDNPGFNLGGFLGVFNATTAFKHYGDIFLTNISSTPSLVESFSEALGNAYPAPDSSLKNKPRYYKDVVKLLKEDYMDKCFPDQEKLKVDYKRFVLTSNSSEMGFKTSFYSTSFANNMKYNSFCKTWINYENEEDLIQVGKMKKWQFVKMQAALIYYKYCFNKSIKKFKLVNEDTMGDDCYTQNENSSAA